jgi:hypothetical protein
MNVRDFSDDEWVGPNDLIRVLSAIRICPFGSRLSGAIVDCLLQILIGRTHRCYRASAYLSHHHPEHHASPSGRSARLAAALSAFHPKQTLQCRISTDMRLPAMQRDACLITLPFLTCRGSLAIDAHPRVTANIGNIRAQDCRWQSEHECRPRAAVIARSAATRQPSRRNKTGLLPPDQSPGSQ